MNERRWKWRFLTWHCVDDKEESDSYFLSLFLMCRDWRIVWWKLRGRRSCLFGVNFKTKLNLVIGLVKMCWKIVKMCWRIVRWKLQGRGRCLFGLIKTCWRIVRWKFGGRGRCLFDVNFKIKLNLVIGLVKMCWKIV